MMFVSTEVSIEEGGHPVVPDVTVLRMPQVGQCPTDQPLLQALNTID